MEAEHKRLAGLIRCRARSHPRKRFLVAIAGIPGSGKTTTARAVIRILNTKYGKDGNDDLTRLPSLQTADVPSISAPGAAGPAVLVAMDGFHLPRAALDQLPNREEAYLRRGAPWTFDVDRFVQFVRELRAWADADTNRSTCSEPASKQKKVIYAPTFDHEAKDPVENGTCITNDASIVIIEGNYLLLDEPGWREIAGLVDFRVFVDADPEEARDRVAKRHVQAGIERNLEDAYRRVDTNDYLNGILIREKLIAPDAVVRSVTEMKLAGECVGEAYPKSDGVSCVVSKA